MTFFGGVTVAAGLEREVIGVDVCEELWSRVMDLRKLFMVVRSGLAESVKREDGGRNTDAEQRDTGRATSGLTWR
jgi:hypothetical protein